MLIGHAVDPAEAMPLLSEEGRRLVLEQQAVALAKDAKRSLDARVAKRQTKGSMPAITLSEAEQQRLLSPAFAGRILALTRLHGEAAIERLAKLTRSKDEKVALGATALMLARGFGAPGAPDNSANGTTDTRQMHLDALRAVAAGAAAGALVGARVAADAASMRQAAEAFVASRVVGDVAPARGDVALSVRSDADVSGAAGPARRAGTREGWAAGEPGDEGPIGQAVRL